MSKIARTPFNASRMITDQISSSRNLSERTKGYTYFVTADSEIDINISYLDKGSYYKFIIKEETTGSITMTLPSLVGLMISDVAGTVSVVEDSGNTLTIPSGAKAGTYIDLLCDGSKWYARGMSAGSAFTITTA